MQFLIHLLKKKNSKSSIYKTAENKISDGDIRGAIRLLSSSDVFAANNSDTFAHFEEKHPPPSRTLNLPDAPNENVDYLSVSEDKVFKAIMSFPNGWFFSWFRWDKTTTSKRFNW
jgi:hypothetical protein